MKKSTATIIFLGICILLAILLLAGVLTPVVSAALFAVSLLILGSASKGFRRTEG